MNSLYAFLKQHESIWDPLLYDEYNIDFSLLYSTISSIRSALYSTYDMSDSIIQKEYSRMLASGISRWNCVSSALFLFFPEEVLSMLLQHHIDDNSDPVIKNWDINGITSMVSHIHLYPTEVVDAFFTAYWNYLPKYIAQKHALQNKNSIWKIKNGMVKSTYKVYGSLRARWPESFRHHPWINPWNMDDIDIRISPNDIFGYGVFLHPECFFATEARTDWLDALEKVKPHLSENMYQDYKSDLTVRMAMSPDRTCTVDVPYPTVHYDECTIDF